MNAKIIGLFVLMVCCAWIHVAAGKPQPASVCLLPIEPGPCKAYVERYGYHPHKRQCVFFIYGGCQGNANNFRTRRECELACGHLSA